MSLLSSQLKELEDKTQEILYLQQELNELNASLKVWDISMISHTVISHTSHGTMYIYPIVSGLLHLASIILLLELLYSLVFQTPMEGPWK